MNKKPTLTLLVCLLFLAALILLLKPGNHTSPGTSSAPPSTAATQQTPAPATPPAPAATLSNAAPAHPLQLLLTLIPSLHRGDTFNLPLPGNSSAPATVNLVTNDGGTLRAGGTLDGHPGASFNLALTPGNQILGQIILQNEGIAHNITTNPDGTLSFETLPLSDVICHPLPRHDDPVQNASDSLTADSAEPADITVPILSSRPAATAVIYLDFDGETVTGTAWNSAYNSGNPIVVQPFATLTETTITNIWKSVAEDYAPFNIDVTTDLTRYNATANGRRIRVIITPTSSWYPNSAGGVAYVNSFAQSGPGKQFASNTPCWVFNSSESGIREAISHEAGHTFGLRHHGRTTPVEEYFRGHGTSPMSWGPIMGSTYTVNLSHWSHGEYAYANNSTQDDVAVISNSTNAFGFAPGGPGNTRLTATVISTNSTQNATITNASDTDYYTFTLNSSSSVTLTANPADYRPNLDIQLTLLDSTGNTLATANPPLLLNATITQTLAPGIYYIKLNGTGYADPLTTGYSNYGSIGQYTLAVSGLNTPDFPSNLAQLPETIILASDDTTTLTANATGNPSPTYQWQISTNNGATWNNLADGPNHAGTTTNTLTISNPAPAMNGNQYRYTATNTHGTTTSNTATLIYSTDPANTIWTNPATGDWTNPANWSNGVPGNLTNATIPAGTANITDSTNARAQTLNLSGTACATLTTTGNSTLTLNTLNLSGATLCVALATHPADAPAKITHIANLDGNLRIDTSSTPASTSTLTHPVLQLPAGTSTTNLSITTARRSGAPATSTSWQNNTLYITIPASAENTTIWNNNNNGPWSTNANWSDGAPTAATAAIINNGTTTITANAAALSLHTSNNTASNSTLTIANYTTLSLRDLIFAYDGSSTLANNGTISTTANAYFGYHSTAAAHIANNGTISTTNNATLYIPYNGNGTLINNGTLSSSNYTYIAYNGSSTATNNGHITSAIYTTLAYGASSNLTLVNNGKITAAINTYFANYGAAHITNNNEITSPTNTYFALYENSNVTLINNALIYSGTFNHLGFNGTLHATNNGNITSAGATRIANYGNTTLVNNGNLTSANYTYAAYYPGSNVTLINNPAGRISVGNTAFTVLAVNGDITLQNHGTISSGSNIHFAENPDATATINNNGTISTTLDLHFSRNGSSTTTNNGTLASANNTYIARYPGSNATLVNNGDYTLQNVAYIAHYGNAHITNTGNFTNHANSTAASTPSNTTYLSYTGNLTLINTGNFTTNNTTYIAYDLGSAAHITNTGNLTLANTTYLSYNASSTVTLVNNGTLTTPNVSHLAYAGNTTLINNAYITAGATQIATTSTARALITLNPGSTFLTNSLFLYANATLRLPLTPNSSLTEAPLQIRLFAPTLSGTLQIDTTALTQNSTLPLIQTPAQTNPAIPNHTLTTAPGTTAQLSWTNNNTLLQLTFTNNNPPRPTLLTPDHHLIHALTDNYTLTSDNTPTTNGTLTHLPKTTLANNTLSITYTPARPAEYTYEVQQSTDLQLWTTIHQHTGNSTLPQTIPSPNSTTTLPTQFLRLKITPTQQ